MGGKKSKSDITSSNNEFIKTTTAQYDILQSTKRIAQNYLLIWVDARNEQSNPDCQNTLTQLQNIVDEVNMFTEPDQCIHFLSKIDDKKVVVIVSEALGRQLVSNIHQMPQLHTIYIFCDNKSRRAEWTKEWPKVKGVYTKMTSICQALQLAVKQCNQDSIGISFIMVNEEAFNQNLDQLESSFIYTQILKEILLEIEYGNKSIKDLVLNCREKYIGNSDELSTIDDFEDNYRPRHAIWWYTRECFIYKRLIRALLVFDADEIINFGFFIRDLHRQIEKLHQKQIHGYRGKSFTVYRGQGLLTIDFEKLIQTRGGLMSFNNFLFTSKKREVSLSFAQGALANSEMVGVLFQMVIDPSITSSPFAIVDDVSFFRNEDEILFSMHTVFRIDEIKKIDNNNRLYQVDLKLIADDDQQLRTLTRRIQEETDGSGWSRMCKLLVRIGQFDKAEELYIELLDQTSDEREQAAYYNNLGSVKTSQGDHNKALWFHEKAVEIYRQIPPPNHYELATSYNNIGEVFQNMREYTTALSFYGKAVKIYEKTLPPDHALLATSYNNISFVLMSMEEYSKALSFSEKAVAIREKILPLNHPDLAASYAITGFVYMNIDEYSKAVSFYEKAVEIYENTLPLDHSLLASSYNNIGEVYRNMGEYTKALLFHEKAVNIYKKTLPPDHALLATSYNNISLVYMNMDEYSKAVSFCEKALAIQEKTLPTNHLDFATTYNNIGLLYYNMEEYTKALSFHEKTVQIYENNLPLDHALLATSYNNISLVHMNTGEYSQALSFCKKAVALREKTLPPDHLDFATTYNNIGLVYYLMEDYSKALSFFERTLDIWKHSLPSDHPNIKAVQEMIEDVKEEVEDNFF